MKSLRGFFYQGEKVKDGKPKIKHKGGEKLEKEEEESNTSEVGEGRGTPIHASIC